MAYHKPKYYESVARGVCDRAIANRDIIDNPILSEYLERIADCRHVLHNNPMRTADSLFNLDCAEHGEFWGAYNFLAAHVAIKLLNENSPLSEDVYQGLTSLSIEQYKDESREHYIDLIESLDKAIIYYLREVDRVLGTHYAPTGALRVQ